MPLLVEPFAGQNMYWATVTSVTDGDTIRVEFEGCPLEDVRVRYIGIDTPERGQCYCAEATARNTALVAGQRVALQRDVSEWDSFGRLLRHVYLQDGTWVNGALGGAVTAPACSRSRHGGQAPEEPGAHCQRAAGWVWHPAVHLLAGLLGTC